MFVLGALGIVRLSIDAPLSLIWMLAYALFVTETFISLSLERGEGSLSNLFFDLSDVFYILPIVDHFSI